MSYRAGYSNNFKKQLKLCAKRGYAITLLEKALDLLIGQGKLPQEYKPHRLSNTKYGNCWECHLRPDWLLIWEQDDENRTIFIIATGSHSDLY